MIPMAVTLVGICLAAPLAVEPEELTRRLSGKQVQMEDLVTSVLGTGENRRLRILRAEGISFLLPENAPKEISGNVRLVGVVRVEGSQVLVDVQKVELLPSDIDQLEQRRASIRDADPAAWYELADWCARRFALYRDPKLQEGAQKAFRTGLEVERRLAGSDLPKLLSLRKRMGETKLVRDLDLDELDHQIAVTRRPDPAASDADTLESAADEWSKAMRIPPGTRAELSQAERQDYDRDPVKVYRSADPARRAMLAREGECRLRRLALQKRVESGQWDPYQASAWAGEHLADDPSIARQWLEKGVAAEEERLPQLRFREVDRLSRRISEELDDAPRAIALRRRWLERREQTLRENEKRSVAQARQGGGAVPVGDVRARFDLADSRLQWFREDGAEQARAAALLLEALSIEPAFEPAVEMLRALGYRRNTAGIWQDPQTVAEEDQARAAMPRSAAIGMEVDAVRLVQGEPDAHARVITGPRQVEWQWCYAGIEQSTYISFRTDGAGRWRVSDIRRVPKDSKSTPQVE